MLSRVAAVLGFSGTPMYANAYALVLNQVFSAGLGFLYWMLAARLYATDVVGTSSAVISALLLISGVAQLGLKSGMTRFVPRAGENRTRLVVSAYVVSIVAAALLSVLAVVLGGSLGLDLGLGDTPIEPVWVVLAATAWSVFYLQDGVLIGLGRAPWVLVDNVLYGLSKIAVLVLGATALASSGIVVSWFAPTPFLIVLITALIFARLIPSSGASAAAASAEELTIGEVVSSVMGDHVGFLVAEATVRSLPLLVIALLGPAENAYFYQAWLVATTLSLVASGMTSSFAAEAAADRGHIGAYSRGILKHMAMLVVPAAAVIGVGAPLVLMLFGQEYAREATPLLRWLALAALPTMFNTWYLGYLLVMGRVRRAVTLQIVGSVLMLGLTWAGLSAFGITGVGVAWLLSQGAISLIAARDAWGVLRAGRGEHHRSDPLDAALGTGEWRFLIPMPPPDRVLLLGETARPATADPNAPDEPAVGYELILARHPTAEDLSHAHAVLEPGGVLYCDWPAWRTGGTAGALRRLEGAGFEDATVYWPAPTLGSARVWLRLWPRSAAYPDAVRAMVRRQLGQRTTYAVVSRLVEVGMRTGRVPSLAVVARKVSGVSTGAAEPYLPDHVDETLRARSGIETIDIEHVMTTAAHRPENKMNFFIFEGEPPGLRWVAKAAAGAGVDSLRAEKDVLEALARDEVSECAVIVPKVVSWQESTGIAVAVYTALNGTPLAEAVGAREYSGLAADVTDALASLARSPEPRPPEEWWARLVEPRLEMLAAQTGMLDEPELADATRSALSQLERLPLVWAHNDCSPWNMLLMPGGFGLLDWETAVRDGLPLVDVVYCLAMMAMIDDGTTDTAAETRTYSGLLDPADERGSVFAENLQAYASKVGLAEADIPPLRVATWLEHATNDLRNLQRDAGERSPLLLRESVTLPLLRLELAAMGLYDPGGPA